MSSFNAHHYAMAKARYGNRQHLEAHEREISPRDLRSGMLIRDRISEASWQVGVIPILKRVITGFEPGHYAPDGDGGRVWVPEQDDPSKMIGRPGGRYSTEIIAGPQSVVIGGRSEVTTTAQLHVVFVDADVITRKVPCVGGFVPLGRRRTLDTAGLGAKFRRMNGRLVGGCPTCGRTTALNARGSTYPHKRQIHEITPRWPSA
ncbi:hypothetical protein GCM10010411_76540 [Actinomadura fulvescens]|uniref:Uncharacterized protein n=1 Tax=Actinomadura fulvescens TaxID=46160 RepID=A0ABN3QJF7_9ACTN